MVLPLNMNIILFYCLVLPSHDFITEASFGLIKKVLFTSNGIFSFF